MKDDNSLTYDDVVEARDKAYTAIAERQYKTIEAMERYGGGFVKALALAYMKADPMNKARIEQAFPEVFEKYKEWAQ